MEMGELLRFCWSTIQNKRRCVSYAVASVAKALIDTVTPLIVGLVINLLVTGSTVQNVMWWCVAAAASGVCSAVLGYYANYTYGGLQIDSDYQLEKRAIDKVWHWRQDQYASYDAAECHRRVNNDSNVISVFFLMSGIKFVVSLGSIVALLVVLLTINVAVAILCGILTMLSGLVYLHLHNEVFRKNLEYKQAFARYATCELSQFADVMFIRRHVLFDRYKQLLDHSIVDVRAGYVRNNEVVARLSSQNAALCACLQAVMLLLGAWQVAVGNMQVGYLATASSYFGMLVSTVQYFTEFGVDYQSCRASFERIKEIWARPQEPNGSQVVSDVHSLGCKDLTFTYPGKDAPTVKGLSTLFEPGQLWAVIGQNGTGKSTLLKLLNAEWAGLYEGSVEYGVTGSTKEPIEQSEVDHYALRRDVFGFVEQEPPIVEDSLWNNLTMMCAEEPSRERVMELVRQFGLEHLLATCPDGLDTVLGESGISLSGGEKQKVAIIRMLLAGPRVMLLDEPTSALDAHSAGVLAQVLREMSRDHVIIVVSHDKKLLSACDGVLELG